LSFTVFAIFISCLGLFGLLAYSAEQRIKEIGIRKVLGAKVLTIILLLSKDYLKLVFLAIFIACPIAWWVMHKWLENFAYRITISWWMMLVSGFLALMITIITVFVQAFKAAIINPIQSLRIDY
jgi:putative ABC transport system permease protein